MLLPMVELEIGLHQSLLILFLLTTSIEYGISSCMKVSSSPFDAWPSMTDDSIFRYPIPNSGRPCRRQLLSRANTSSD